MRKLLGAVLCMSFFVAGCGEPKMTMMEPPQKPVPPPELAKLEPWVGTWTGSAEFVMPEQMGGEKYAGGGTNSWTMDGMFLKGDGWHEMGEGVRAQYVEYWTWDPKAKKYRSWYFSNQGEFGQGWGNFAADGKTMHSSFKGCDVMGNTMSGEGEMTMVNDRNMEWEFSMKSSNMGKMKMKGTSQKQ